MSRNDRKKFISRLDDKGDILQVCYNHPDEEIKK